MSESLPPVPADKKERDEQGDGAIEHHPGDPIFRFVAAMPIAVGWYAIVALVTFAFLLPWSSEVGYAAKEFNGVISAIAGLLVAGFTFALKQSTDKLWLTAKTQSDAMRGQLAAMDRQLTLARDVFTAEQRPWIAVDVELASELKWIHGYGAMKLRVTFRNTGKTPALSVSAMPHLYPFGVGFSNPIQMQKIIADDARQKASRGTAAGITIFPDESRTTVIGVQISRADIAETHRAFAEAARKDSRHPKVPIFQAMLVGAVTYFSTFPDTLPHQTGFIHPLNAWKKIFHNDNDEGQQVVPTTGDIPFERLSLGERLGSGVVD